MLKTHSPCITLKVNPNEGDSITINKKTYTFGVDVTIGKHPLETLMNLIRNLRRDKFEAHLVIEEIEKRWLWFFIKLERSYGLIITSDRQNPNKSIR
jgi:hypothetical protein